MKIREGVEMTLTDAVAKSIGVPLWRLFGAASDSITTEITVQCILGDSLIILVIDDLSFYFLCFIIHLSCKSNSGLSEKWGRVCFVSFSTFSVLPGVV